MADILPNIYFGPLNDEDLDDDEELEETPEDDLDDDEELEETPEEVKVLLGFDPLDLDKD